MIKEAHLIGGHPRRFINRLSRLSSIIGHDIVGKSMALRRNRKKDLSASLLWTPFAPIDAVTDENREAVAKWLEDRSALLIWLTSIITGSLVLVTLFGRKPGFDSVSQIFLSIAVLLLFLAVLLNLICAWQIPKWKFAVRTAQISNGKRMMWDLEISSWLSFTSFLAGLVFAVIGNL